MGEDGGGEGRESRKVGGHAASASSAASSPASRDEHDGCTSGETSVCVCVCVGGGSLCVMPGLRDWKNQVVLNLPGSAIIVAQCYIFHI